MNAMDHAIFDNLTLGEIFRLKLDHENTRLMLHRDSQPEVSADIRDLGFSISHKIVHRVVNNFQPALFGVWLSGLISREQSSPFSISLIEPRNWDSENIDEIFIRHERTSEFVFVVGHAPSVVDWDRYTC